jgi:hypothetical protein
MTPAADRPTITPKIVTVTPELAEQLLGRNTHNRNVNTRIVAKYARDMKNGEWEFNGEAIKIADDGTMLDGQHRVLAVIEADVAIDMLVIEGLKRQTQNTMDDGRKRSLADALRLKGEKDVNNLAAALRMLYSYERHGVPSQISSASATTRECIDVLERNPGLRESADYTKNQRGKQSASKIIAASYVTSFHYIFNIAQSNEDATRFFDLLGSGDGLKAGDPIHTLRERMIDDKMKSGRAESLGTNQKLAFIVRSFNGWMQGETLQKLQWRAGGAHPDAFPRVLGWKTIAMIEAEQKKASKKMKVAA